VPELISVNSKSPFSLATVTSDSVLFQTSALGMGSPVSAEDHLSAKRMLGVNERSQKE